MSWEGFGSYVGRCWLQDGVFQAILGYVMASWSQDEPTGAQESDSSRIWWGSAGAQDRRYNPEGEGWIVSAWVTR